jgi:hypothetical protein
MRGSVRRTAGPSHSALSGFPVALAETAALHNVAHVDREAGNFI